MQVEDLKSKLYHYMDKYGFTNKKTVEISQQLDKSIIIEQRRLNYVD